MGLVFECACLDWVLFVGLTVFYVQHWLTKRYSYFKTRGIPYVKPVFTLGNTWRVWAGKETIAECYQKLYDQLKGKRFGGFFQFARPVILVRDPETVNKFLIQDFVHFQDHGIDVDEVTNPLEGNLFNLNGDKWRALRRKLAPVFTSGKLRWMFDSVTDCADQLVASIKTDQDVDLKDTMARYSVDVIASCAFGLKSNSISDSNSQFRRIGNKIFEPSLGRTVRMILRFAIPSLYMRLKLKTISQEVNDFFFSIVSGAFEHRKRTGEVRRDFLQLLLQLREKGEVDLESQETWEEGEEQEAKQFFQASCKDKLEITDELLTAQAFVFFVGGFETTSSTLSYALYLLGEHPEVQERARAEVKRIKAARGALDYDACSEMTYLTACISETLRVYAPAQILIRVCTKSLTIVEGLEIEKGTSVVIPVHSIHTDPKIYPEPNVFKPERFLAEDFPPKGAYLPFGGGPRICIARRFALLEMKLALAKILDTFFVRPSPKMKGPLKFKQNGSLLFSPIGGVWGRFSRL